MPLSLSDAELAAIMDAAAPIPRRDRTLFLREVEIQLSKCAEVDPGVIGRVCAEAQRKYFNPPTFVSIRGVRKYDR